MGAECSSENMFDNQSLNDKDKLDNITFEDQLIFSHLLIKSSAEFYKKQDIFRKKLCDLIKKVQINKEFSITNDPEIYFDRLEDSYITKFSTMSTVKLFEIALNIYRKIATVFGNSYNYPKQELSKINYNLLARYVIVNEDDERETAKKILKRINFFSDDFPYKLKKLEQIIESQNIYVFGYDIYYRITFYLRPNFYTTFKNQNIDKTDYIIYIFFIMEFFQTTLVEKYKFSDQVNLVVDFNNQELDSELIKLMIYYFNLYYPLLLNKLHVVNYNPQEIDNNFSFKDDLLTINKYKQIEFWSKSFKYSLIKDYNPNCLPKDYGGYHIAEVKQVKNPRLDEFIENILDQILVKSI